MPTERNDPQTAAAREHSQLRFAFFLQVAAGLMLIVAVVIRVAYRRLDLVTLICALAAIGVFAFAAFTRSRLRR